MADDFSMEVLPYSATTSTTSGYKQPVFRQCRTTNGQWFDEHLNLTAFDLRETLLEELGAWDAFEERAQLEVHPWEIFLQYHSQSFQGTVECYPRSEDGEAIGITVLSQDKRPEFRHTLECTLSEAENSMKPHSHVDKAHKYRVQFLESNEIRSISLYSQGHLKPGNRTHPSPSKQGCKLIGITNDCHSVPNRIQHNITTRLGIDKKFLAYGFCGCILGDVADNCPCCKAFMGIFDNDLQMRRIVGDLLGVMVDMLGAYTSEVARREAVAPFYPVGLWDALVCKSVEKAKEKELDEYMVAKIALRAF
ncbi:hypothetical protein BJ878DRAFT_545321 [Calycina marina]|uniref:Uncharacterized protein n=1 Tax=Calycina marina TaxID=1763456 RepID=A0A9P7YWN1_9HELO|nr:hypothetical protein BJ878DRAFT_545321 [Calycina marina]